MKNVTFLLLVFSSLFSFGQEHNYLNFPLNKKKDINKAAVSSCDNLDFEVCDFSGWEMYVGDVDNNLYNILNATSTSAWCNEAIQSVCPDTLFHKIVMSGIDGITGFISKTNQNGGSCSVLLGDTTNARGKAAILKKTFTVSTANVNFSYSYALVFQDNPGYHAPKDSPFFQVNMFDENGDSITCGTYATTGDGEPDWIVVNGGTRVYQYKDWTTMFVSLQNYIGQDVTIEFIVGDCSNGGHYGYAYLDVNCGKSELILEEDTACGVTLIAPKGGSSYLWTPTGDTTRIIIPQISGVYSVNIIPSGGSSCGTLTYDTTIIVGSKSVVADFSHTSACVGIPTAFTDLSVAIGTTITTWEWDFDSDGIIDDTNQNPIYIYNFSGVFKTKFTITSSDGCVRKDSVDVIVSSAPCINNVNQENSLLRKIEVYPNPTDKEFTLLIELIREKNINIRLIDLLGQEVNSFRIQNRNLHAGENKLLMDASDVHSGIYFFLIQVGGREYVNKLVIE